MHVYIIPKIMHATIFTYNMYECIIHVLKNITNYAFPGGYIEHYIQY